MSFTDAAPYGVVIALAAVCLARSRWLLGVPRPPTRTEPDARLLWAGLPLVWVVAAVVQHVVGGWTWTMLPAAGVMAVLLWPANRPRTPKAARPLPPEARRASVLFGGLSGLYGLITAASPFIATARAETAGQAQALELGASLFQFVGAAAFALSLAGGSPRPKKWWAVSLVVLGAIGFGVDARLHTPTTLTIAFAVGGVMLPILSTLGDAAAAQFPSHTAAYTGRRQGIAALVSFGGALVFAGLEAVGWGALTTPLLTAGYAVLAVLLARFQFLAPGQTTRLWRAVQIALGWVGPVHGWIERHLQSAPRRAERCREPGSRRRREKGPWSLRGFRWTVLVFVVAQFLGSAGGIAMTNQITGAGHTAAVAGFAVTCSRLLAAAASLWAGKLGDATGRDIREIAHGVTRAGALFLVCAVPFALTGPLTEGFGFVAIMAAYFVPTLALNGLLTLSRTLLPKKVPPGTAQHQASYTNFGLTGKAAGFIGHGVAPLAVPPDGHGAGANVGALVLMVFGGLTFVAGRRLTRADDPKPVDPGPDDPA